MLHGLPELFSVRDTFRISIVKVFTEVRDLLNLLRNFDLIIISFLSHLLLLYLIFFVYKEQQNLMWIEIAP